MNMFSKVNGPYSISNSPGGVWKIEKKRKARDKKNKQQKNLNRKKEGAEEEDSFSANIEPDNSGEKECEDLTGYGLTKKKKPACNRIDLKI